MWAIERIRIECLLFLTYQRISTLLQWTTASLAPAGQLSTRIGMALCVVVCAMPTETVAMPVIFELETFGRLESGTLSFDDITVTLRYRFDSGAPDSSSSPTTGSYSSQPNALLTVGSESSSMNDGAGIFTEVGGNYTVGISWHTAGYEHSYFLGRDIVSSVFVLVDLNGDMFLNDALPFNAGFDNRADDFFTRLSFIPIPGDPNFGLPGESTHFDMCNAAITDRCVHAPISVARVGLPEPGALMLFVIVLGALVLSGCRPKAVRA